MRGNGASEEKRSIQNSQRQIDSQTKEEYEQGEKQQYWQKETPAKVTCREADLTNDKRAMH